MAITSEQAMELRSLAYKYAKAAQAFEAATPGTQTKRLRERAFEKADNRLADYIDSLRR